MGVSESSCCFIDIMIYLLYLSIINIVQSLFWSVIHYISKCLYMVIESVCTYWFSHSAMTTGWYSDIWGVVYFHIFMFSFQFSMFSIIWCYNKELCWVFSKKKQPFRWHDQQNLKIMVNVIYFMSFPTLRWCINVIAESWLSIIKGGSSGQSFANPPLSVWMSN